MPSDVELLEAWRGGDPAAAEALLERHFATLCRFFRNKVDAGVEDLIQQRMILELLDVDKGDRLIDGELVLHAILMRWWGGKGEGGVSVSAA